MQLPPAELIPLAFPFRVKVDKYFAKTIGHRNFWCRQWTLSKMKYKKEVRPMKCKDKPPRLSLNQDKEK
jgi:hypothetical protein